MKKLKLHSPDLTQARAANGVLKKSMGFDQRRQELSGSMLEGPQQPYQLNWTTGEIV